MPIVKYDDDLCVCAISSNKTLSWDLNGWQTSQLSSSPADYFLECDWDGRLRKAQAGVATKYITATYTPTGVRIAKTRSFGDADDYDHKYIVDVSGKLPKILLILDASTKAILKTFVHAHDQVIAQHDGDSSDNIYFYTHDRLGSVRQVFDPTDLSVKNNYAYDAWGLIIDSETTENIWNPYRFAGYLWDSEISMYYCNARMYDPVLGRFTSRDPVRGSFREPMTLHVYLYCGNDPVNRTDPKGKLSAALLANPILTGSALYGHGINLATYAVSSENDKFWKLSEATFYSMIPAMGIAAANPLSPLRRTVVWALEGAYEGMTGSVTGLTPIEAFAMDVGAYAGYYAMMLALETHLGIDTADMQDFIEWKWDW